MKAILLLIAVIAVASARISGSDVYIGFSTKLGFSLENHKAAQACAMEVTTLARSFSGAVKNDFNKKALALLFADDTKHREFLVNIHNFVKNIFPQCKNFVSSLAPIFSKVHQTLDEQYISPRNLVFYRYGKHADYIISSIVKAIDAAHENNGKEVGANIAFIVQILSGITHPETVADYIKNHKQPIEVAVLEVDTFIQKTINTVAKELGLKQEVTVQRVKELREAVQGFAMVQFSTQMRLYKAQSTLEKQVIIFGAIRDYVKVAGVVAENLKLTALPFVQGNPNVVKTDGKSLIKRVIHNYYGSFTVLERRVMDAVLGAKAHKPVATGKAIAEIISLLVATHHKH